MRLCAADAPEVSLHHRHPSASALSAAPPHAHAALPQEEPEAFDASLDRPIREPQRDVEVSALEPDAMASLSSRIFEVQAEEWLKRKLEELR